MSLVLEVDGLCKAYVDGRGRRDVLAGVGLTLNAAEIVAVCGPSGSGKTTLLNLIAGLDSSDAGSLRLHAAGQVIEPGSLDEAGRAAMRRAHIGYIFQFFNLVPTLTVRENVLLPLELNRRPDLAEPALARLADLGVADTMTAFPEDLSGGERQRVAIARALAHQPRLVLADEPTGNLDAASARAVVDLLWREVRRLQGALLIATHDNAVAALADRSIELEAVAAPPGAA